jgi:hypothetical protein
MNRSERRNAITKNLSCIVWMNITELRAHIAHERATPDAPEPMPSAFGILWDAVLLNTLDVPSAWRIGMELRRMRREGLVECRRVARYRLNMPVGWTREWRRTVHQHAKPLRKMPPNVRLDVVQ